MVKIDRGRIAFAVLAVALATLFVRLGLWQLDRHGERREANEVRRERMALPPLSPRTGEELAALPPPESLAWRRLRVGGRWDFENEILLRPRSHAGRPAIELLTPLLLSDGSAVLVLRGWLPAPDALHAPIRSARPARDSASVEGLAMAPPATRHDAAGLDSGGPPRAVVDGEEHLALRAPDLETASDALDYPIADFYIRQSHDEPTGSDLRPLPAPETGPGPHMAYAIQWFAFALIAVGGTAAFLASRR